MKQFIGFHFCTFYNLSYNYYLFFLQNFLVGPRCKNDKNLLNSDSDDSDDDSNDENDKDAEIIKKSEAGLASVKKRKDAPSGT